MEVKQINSEAEREARLKSQLGEVRTAELNLPAFSPERTRKMSL